MATGRQGPFRETDSVDLPVSPYAATKKACELLAHTFHHLHGLPVTGLRFFTAFGPRNRPDLAIAKFVRLIDHGQPVPMFGDGSTRRDYTYVLDIVDGIVRAIDQCAGHHLYNLGHSEPIALRDMIATIARALGKRAVIEALAEQPGDVRQTYAAIDLARRELGYAPDDAVRRGHPALRRLVSDARQSSDALEPRRSRSRPKKTAPATAKRPDRPARLVPIFQEHRLVSRRGDGRLRPFP